MSNKRDEKEMLFTVYKKELIENTLVEDETPDFILTDPENNCKIGVEITTLFTSEDSAISKKSDRFLDSFIDQNKTEGSSKKKQKSKYKRLQVASVEGDDSLAHKGAVVWHIATLQDFFSFFEKIISQKSGSYEKLIKGLQFVNLIARDDENFFKPGNRANKILKNLKKGKTVFEKYMKFRENKFPEPHEGMFTKVS